MTSTLTWSSRWYECGGVRVEEAERGEVTAGVGVA